MTTKLFDRYYPILCETAFSSPVKVKLVAGILKDRKLVGRPKCNIDRNLYRGYYYGSTHAEAGALMDYFGKDICFDRTKHIWSSSKKKKNKLDIIVMRISSDGKPANARPCFHCLRMMNDMGLHRVYYTTGLDKEIVCENINEMFSIQLSYVSRIIYNTKELSRDNYFQSIMKENFPKIIRERNLVYFIEYNYKSIFPKYPIQYEKRGSDNLVYFYNLNNEVIVWSIVR
jgi:hypothetical protein